jgi:NAD(P)H dehydrogenase (quinone)
VRAAVLAGVRHVVYVSAIAAGPGPDIAEAHFATELALYQSGLQWTILRMGIFSETLFFGPLQRAIESGSYAAPASAPVAYLSRDDLAAAAATILAKPGHEYATYHATGPAAITQQAIAVTLSKLTGRLIPYIEVTEEEYRQCLVSAGLAERMVDIVMELRAAMKTGRYDIVSGDTARLAGRPAESFEAFLARSRVLLSSAA